MPHRADGSGSHADLALPGRIQTSMLQDVEAGRRLELDAIVASVREIGFLVGLPTPNIDIMLGLTRLKARTIACNPQA